jgi:peroxiredoxin (alkyl hydroperoxide reductase subunit C)
MTEILIGRAAPIFSAQAIVDGKIQANFSLHDFLGKYVVFFFYPLDFTFVCPTELHAFEERIKEFTARNAQLVACSVDSCYSHSAWLSTPRAKGGIEGVTYPIVSDLSKNISRSFQVLKEEDGISYRGLYILDRKGIIRHQLINDLPIGRSVEEVLRTLDAIIFHDTHGEVCPANWHKQAKAMTPTKEGLVRYFS